MSAEARRIFAPAAASTSTDGEVVILPLRGEHPVRLPAYLYDFLSACQEFRTLPEHLEEYAAAMELGYEERNGLRDAMRTLETSGLLISESALLAQLREGGGAAPALIPDAACIPTGGHPERLERSAGTLLANAAAHGHPLELLVADNSRTAEIIEANGAVLAKLAERFAPHQAQIVHLSPQRASEYAAALAARSGCAAETVRFALLGSPKVSFACGTNRNLGLLFGAGRLLVSLDDDVAASWHQRESVLPGVQLFSKRDVLLRDFFVDRSEMEASIQPSSGDLLGAMGQTLGATLADLLHERSGAVFGPVDSSFVTGLYEAPPRVLAAFPGHFGDPGIPTSCYYLGFRGATLRNLTASAGQYAAALRSRCIRSCVEKLSVGDLSLTPGMCFGLDARELVPPFFPILHAEDFSWGAALARTRTGGLAAHLPFCLRHDPGAGKGIITPQDLEEMAPGVVFEFAHLLRHLILIWTPVAGRKSALDRLQDLGRYLEGWGCLSSAEFADASRTWAMQLHSGMVTYYEELLRSESAAPDWWREDVERYVGWQVQASCRSDLDVPVDLRSLGTPDEIRKLMKEWVGEYGRLLQAWPSLVKAARDLPGFGTPL